MFADHRELLHPVVYHTLGSVADIEDTGSPGCRARSHRQSGVGWQILEQTVAAGHEVTAVVRNRGKPSAPVRTVTADLATADPAALKSRWRGLTRSSPATVPGPRPRRGSRWRDTQADVAVMKAADVRRIALVSAGLFGTVPSPAHRRGVTAPRGRWRYHRI
ncbi:NAD(P)H-binding protein [Streptomyces sp. NPDC059680]|uniref:NAD(P)H-binding protein n=1 Tax=Streptomyces sp. NPDC059680 TaxID=3346904 RepID=UPI003692929F